MARVTVEDCIEKIPNRFELVRVASRRTKDLLRGSDSTVVNEDENKEVVLALREIAAGAVQIKRDGEGTR